MINVKKRMMLVMMMRMMVPSHVHSGEVSCYSVLIQVQNFFCHEDDNLMSHVNDDSNITTITRAFFRRGIGKPYCCVEGKGDCTIDFTSRRSCQWCRFDKYINNDEIMRIIC